MQQTQHLNSSCSRITNNKQQTTINTKCYKFYLFVSYLTSKTVLSKNYSVSYPMHYSEYHCQQQNYSWQNYHFFWEQHHKRKRSVLNWNTIIKINKATVYIHIIHICIYVGIIQTKMKVGIRFWVPNLSSSQKYD